VCTHTFEHAKPPLMPDTHSAQVQQFMHIIAV
jgi:hypothetical protein